MRQTRQTIKRGASKPVYRNVAEAVDGLTKRGFIEHFRIDDGNLRATESGGAFPAADVIIREVHRFEGVSDPDNMAVVYAVETQEGVRGTLTDAFGVYSDPGMSEALDGALVSRKPDEVVEIGEGSAPESAGETARGREGLAGNVRRRP